MKVPPPVPFFHKPNCIGLAKNIGVSNFRIKDLETILKIAKHKPVINQIEFHPYLQQNKLRQYLAENDILLEAYAPLVPLTTKTDGPLTPIIDKIAKKQGKTPAQVHPPRTG
jgi:2-dehydropantolactone reductase